MARTLRPDDLAGSRPDVREPGVGRDAGIGGGRRAMVASVAAILLVAAMLTISTVTSLARAYPSSLLPSQGAYLGSRIEARDGESQQDAIRRVEGQIGRKVAIDHAYYLWNDSIPTAHQRWDIDTGRIPFLNWKPQEHDGSIISWSAIANGSQDDWIARRADAFRAFGAPIYLAFHHEPEDDLGGWGSPGEYAAAFRRIVSIFRNREVTNVAFVWTLMSWTYFSQSGRDVMEYYPGDGYVDFVGSDVYSWFPRREGSVWRSFQEIAQPTNDFAVAHSKPWMAVEYGVQEDPGQPGRKGQWFRDVLQTAKAWPNLKGLIYYDVVKEGYPWVTDSSESSMAGYRDLAQDPYMNPQGGGGSPSPTPPPPPPPGGMPATVRNGLNTGPDGGDIRASGGKRGFDAVTTTSGAMLKYSDEHARGPFSAKHLLNERSDAYYEWDGTRSVWFGRIYVWLPSLPPSDLRLVRAREDGDLRCSISILPSGSVSFADQENRVIAASRYSVAVGRWIRIEWKIDHVRGRAKIKLYVRANAEKPTDIFRVGPRLDIGGRANQFQFGRSGNQPFSFTMWTDSPAMSTKRFLGPAV